MSNDPLREEITRLRVAMYEAAACLQVAVDAMEASADGADVGLLATCIKLVVRGLQLHAESKVD